MTTHDLKTWPAMFTAVLSGAKTAELRKADRPFAVGDTLRLREWDPEIYADCVADGATHEDATEHAYSGRALDRTVTHIVHGGQFGLEAGYVMLSLGEAAGYAAERRESAA